MRWLFGCFGCSKSSSDRSPAPLPRKNRQRNNPSHYTLPSRIPVASSSSAFRQNLVERSAVEKLKEKTYINNRKDYGDTIPIIIRTPEREKKIQKEKDYLSQDHPLSQLDELEAELEDLRKQIDRETEDAKRLREEVSVLKSRDTLRNAQKEQQQQHHQQPPYGQFSYPEGGSNPRFVSKSPIQTPGKISSMSGLGAHEPTPIKEFHSLLHGITTPTSNKRLLAQSATLNHSLQDNTEEEEKEQKPIPYAGKGLSAKPKFMRSNDAASPDSQDLFDIPDEFMRMHGGYSNQEDLSKYEEHNHSHQLRNGIKTIKKKISGNREESCSSLQETSEDGEIDDASNETIVESISRNKSVTLPKESTVQIHYFGCDTLSPISESEESDESIASSESSSKRRDYKNKSNGGGIDTEDNSESISQCQSDSASYGYMKGTPRGPTKAVSKNRNSTYVTDEVCYDNKQENRHTQERYSNDSSCIDDCTEELYSEEYSSSSIVDNDTEEKYSRNTSSVHQRYEDDGASSSFSQSADCDETVSELSPEPCFSPPISYSQQRSGKRCEDEDSSSANTCEAIGTEQFDEHYRKCGGSYKSFMSNKFTQMDDSDYDQTPLKLPECVTTPPTAKAHELRGNCSRVRNNRLSSSVLTPVENVSQWMQLKQRDNFNPSSSQSTLKEKELEEFVNKKEKRWDENIHGFSSSECMSLRVDTSFSHWAPKTTTKGTEVDTIRVDASLSHWLGSSSIKHSSKVLSSNKNSSAEEGGVIAKASPQEVYISPGSKSSVVEQRKMPGVSNTNGDASTQDYFTPSGTKKLKQVWSGQGIPNTTTKYKEDQRVKWYGSPFEARLEKALYSEEHGGCL